MKKKTILIGTVHMEVGGIEKTLLGLLKRINYSKYDVDLFLLKTNGDFMNEIPSKVNVITPSKLGLLKKISNSSNILCKCIKHTLFNSKTSKYWIPKKEYDVAISYSGYYHFIDNIIACANAKFKYIWVHTDLKFLYNNDTNYQKKFNKIKNRYDKFDKIICVSESVKTSFIKLLPQYKNKAEVLWNTIDITKNCTNNTILNGDKKIISVGRLCDQKRFDRLIDIQKKLKDNGYNTTVYLIGAGEKRELLENKIKENNLENTFIMLGKQIDVTSLIKQCDLFVSTSDCEGWPTVLLETLICGVPFVGPKVSGVGDIAKFIAPKNSCIITDNNTNSIYNGVVEALNGKVGKDFIFDVEKYNNECINKFYNLINNK